MRNALVRLIPKRICYADSWQTITIRRIAESWIEDAIRGAAEGRELLIWFDIEARDPATSESTLLVPIGPPAWSSVRIPAGRVEQWRSIADSLKRSVLEKAPAILGRGKLFAAIREGRIVPAGELENEWETFLRIDGWRSGYESVDRVLRHYARRLKSEKTRRAVGKVVYGLCRFAGRDPDELVGLPPEEASEIVQDFLDSKREKGLSIRTLNTYLAYARAFFKANGFKGDRELAVESYYQPARYRKTREYVPTPEEIYRMAIATGSRRNRAMILALYTSGLRNATLRALRYRDVKDELERGFDMVRVPVYPEMKEVDPAACKGESATTRSSRRKPSKRSASMWRSGARRWGRSRTTSRCSAPTREICLPRSASGLRSRSWR